MLQQHELCPKVTHGEIKAALFEIDRNKSPRLNGFTILFFKKACSIVKEDTYQAIEENVLLKAPDTTVVNPSIESTPT